MIRYRFNEAKTAEASLILLTLDGGEMDKVRLMKLLYLADRESLDQRLLPITGDVYYSMEHGPVLSTVLHLMNLESHTYGAIWTKAIAMHGYKCTSLRRHETAENLSEAEVEILRRISDKFFGFDTWQLREYTHAHCTEYVETDANRRNPLRVEDVLRALGKNDDDLERARELAMFQSFSSECPTA